MIRIICWFRWPVWPFTQFRWHFWSFYYISLTIFWASNKFRLPFLGHSPVHTMEAFYDGETLGKRSNDASKYSAKTSGHRPYCVFTVSRMKPPHHPLVSERGDFITDRRCELNALGPGRWLTDIDAHKHMQHSQLTFYTLHGCATISAMSQVTAQL